MFFWGCGSIDWPEVPVYGTTFWTDDPTFFDALTSDVARLAAATGRADIAVSPDGARVSVVPDVTVAGVPSCGSTAQEAASMVVDLAAVSPPGRFCNPPAVTFLHEAMHVLAPDAVHSATGIFAQRADATTVIDEASLTALCSAFRCQDFRPETQISR